MALQGGEPVLLPDEEMASVGKRYGNYGTGLLDRPTSVANKE